jgi:hypothetical protein
MLILNVSPKVWETNFFGFKYGSIAFENVKNIEIIRSNPSVLKKELTDILAVENENYDYIELALDSRYFFTIPIFEDLGFRLLDTKSTYITKFENSKLENQMFSLVDENLTIRNKRDSDFETILKMSVDVLVKDKVFVSKYKNLDFFEPHIADKYYTEWIKNTFISERSFFAILTDKTDKIKGYFIYDKRLDTIEELPIYKGILTVVDPDVRGKNIHLALQSFIFKQIKDEFFYIENATQVSNIPVIRNHIRSHRMLDSVTFILLRKKSI